MSRKIGYARVSTLTQSLNRQIEDLVKAGCSKSLIFCDIVSGTKSIRTGLSRCLSELKSGDTLVVCALDRLSRSADDLMEMVNFIKSNSISIKSLTQPHLNIDDPIGLYNFRIASANSQLELDVSKQRIMSGLESSRKAGVFGGRPKINLKDPKVIAANAYASDPEMTPYLASKALGVSIRTYYRYLKLNNEL